MISGLVLLCSIVLLMLELKIRGKVCNRLITAQKFYNRLLNGYNHYDQIAIIALLNQKNSQ